VFRISVCIGQVHLLQNKFRTTKMSSCDEEAPVFFSFGGRCGGVGTCVNSTSNPSQLLCLCSPGYSGASDFFDSRVEQLSDGTWLSLACGSSVVGTYVVWGFFLFCNLVRTYQLIMVILSILKKHHEDPKRRKAGYSNNFALKVVAFDLLVTSSCAAIGGITKMCGLTFGTDILATVSLSLGNVSFNITNFMVQRREFALFSKGSMTTDDAAVAQRTRTCLKLMSLFLYIGAVIVPNFYSLALNKSLGPIMNNQFIIIIFRNAGTILWGQMEILTTWMVRRRIQQLVQISRKPMGEADAVLIEVGTRLGNELKSLIRFFSSLGVVYSIFLIPQFYPYQTYLIAVLLGFGLLRHSGKNFHSDSSVSTGSNKKATVSDVASGGAAALSAVTVGGDGSFLKSGDDTTGS
jgi:hypothetical protein